jgi:16S rRNA (guanine527-N7)-methyltransferase
VRRPRAEAGIADHEALDGALASGAKALGVTLGASARDTLLDYLALLESWSRSFNLTAVRDPAQMVPRHLLDSLAVVPWVHGRTLLDVGSGAGLPGLVLAVALPGLQVSLLDPSLKRTRFLLHARDRLRLDGLRVVRARLDELGIVQRFDVVTARASLPLPQLLAAAPRWLAPGGRLLAMLGRVPVELPVPAVGYRLEVIRLQVPGLAAERHLAVLRAPGLPPRPAADEANAPELPAAAGRARKGTRRRE